MKSIFSVLVLSLLSSSVYAETPMRNFRTKCASCHGVDGKGNTAMGKKLGVSDFTNKEWSRKTSLDAIIDRINDGFVKDGRQVMPGFRDKLGQDEIGELALYVAGLAK